MAMLASFIVLATIYPRGDVCTRLWDLWFIFIISYVMALTFPNLIKSTGAHSSVTCVPLQTFPNPNKSEREPATMHSVQYSVVIVNGARFRKSQSSQDQENDLFVQK